MFHLLRRRRRPLPYGDAGRRGQPGRLAVAALLAVTLAPTAAEAKVPRIVAFGDSLMAGYELPAKNAYPARLEATLRAGGIPVEISNASVSGDTTTGGLDRLDWSVPDGTDGVLLELGANDMLRGQDPRLIERNLDTMIARLKQRGIAVYLLGMKADPALGPDYGARFDAIYPDLARTRDLPLSPFLLDGVVGHPALQLADGVHPNADGVGVMVQSTLAGISAWARTLAGTP